MPNTQRVSTPENDQSTSTPSTPAGISGVSLVMKRGPIGVDPDLIITSDTQLKAIYGGLSQDSDDPLMALLLLQNGSKLRINNVRHYTDVSDPDTLTADYATVNATNGGAKVAFTGTITTGNLTLAITGFTSAVVPFNTNAAQTVKDALAKLISLNPGKIADYQIFGTTPAPIFSIAPRYGYTLAGITLTATGVTGTTVTQYTSFAKGANAIFQLIPKGPGADYDKLLTDVRPPSNGRAGYFNLLIQIDGETDTTEFYENLKADGPYNTADQTWLDNMSSSSNLVEAVYVDLSAITGDIVPDYGIRTFDNGDDGDAVTDNDFIGAKAGKTGFYAFDSVDDIDQVAAPTRSSGAVHNAGNTYATTRQDLVYMAHLDNGLTTEAALVSAKDAMLIDSSYTEFYAGGVTVIDPQGGKKRNMSELSEMIALAAVCAVKYGPYKSFSGTNRGIFKSAIGVVNNFANPGNYEGLQLLAQHQINLAVVEDKQKFHKGNLTGQLKESLLSYSNVRRGIIYAKKRIKVTVKPFLDEPNFIPTWKKMYLAVLPELDAMVTNEAWESYRWEGDQFAKDLDSLTVNNRTDINKGKYKVKLFIRPINAIREIEITVTIVGSSISFEEALNDGI